MDDDADPPTPHSPADQPLLKAPKDKNCPFCGQPFTSSSLGRHLDLYIRPKNPKAPDGIHLVDEIRKLRGRITRRQIKLKGKDGRDSRDSISEPRREGSGTSTPTNKKQSTVSEDSLLVQSPEEADNDCLEVAKRRPQGPFKDVTWSSKARQPSRLGTKTPDVRREVSRQVQKADLDQRNQKSDEVETANATELALRELLKSVREANAKACGSGVFDFDPYTLSFPALCLRILPAPSTLFSPSPFPTPESWSILPPGQKQFEALNRQVRERLLNIQRQRQINQVYPSGQQSTASSVASSPLPTPPLFDPDPQKLFGHIAEAFSHWGRQAEQTRQECWQVEILRSFARAEDRRRETEVQLENARREIEYLKTSRWTSGAPDVSPVSITLGMDTVKELGKFGMDFRNWDFDRVVEKCKTAIRESRASVSGMAAQRALPGGPASTRSCSMASLPPQPFAAIVPSRQGSPIKVEALPYTAPPTVNGDADLGSDQIDAEGDDDDEDIDLTPHTASDEDPMNHIQHQVSAPHHQVQHHIIPIQPTPIHPSQQTQSHMHTPMHVTQAQVQHAQAQAQAQAQAVQHAQAQAQAWARQHMNQSRNQDFRPHQHQQLSPHVQHINSANNSRRPSLAMMDPHAMNPNTVGNMTGSIGMPTGMEGMDSHADQFLRMDMTMSGGFVGGNDGGVSMGA